jgi:hypothetical protein
MKNKLLKKNIIPLEFNGSYKGVAYLGEYYQVDVKESEEGIILDIWTSKNELETFTFLNDDVIN